MLGPRGEDWPGFDDAETAAAAVRSSRGRALKPKRCFEEEADLSAPGRRTGKNGARDATEQYRDDDFVYGVDTDRAYKARKHTHLSGAARDDCAEQGNLVAWPGRRAVHEKPPRREYASGRGGGIFKSAAVQVLRLTKRLMCTGDITAAAVKHGFLAVQGRTPEATMASALYTDVKRKEARSVFIRPQEGLFGLREWLPSDDSLDSQRSLQDTTAFAGSVLDDTWQPDWEARAAIGQGEGRLVKSQQVDTLVERESCSPARTVTKRQFSNNMEVLMAAVEEVSRGKQAASTPENHNDDSKWEAALSLQVAKEESPVQETFQLQMPACSADASHTEDGSSSQSLDTAAPPLDLGGAQPAMPQPLVNQPTLSGLMLAAQAEIAVQALEADVSSDPSVVMQGYMHLCKVYGEAGLLEKACSSLARAMEIGEAIARP